MSSRKLRILYTIPNFDTAGSGQAMLNVATGLNKTQFEAHIACKTDAGAFFKTVKQSGIPVHVFNYEPPMRPLSQLGIHGWKTSRTLKEIAPDIIHSFHYNNNYGEAVAAKLAGIDWIFTKKNMNWGTDGANAWKIRSMLAKHIILQNSEMKRRFYPNRKTITQIECSVVASDFEPKPAQEEIKDLMHTPQQARVLIAVAHITPVKGLNVLLEAFHKLANQFIDWHLWFVGDDKTPCADELKELVEDFNLSKRVHFSGRQPNVPDYLAHAELFVLPTKPVGEGNPVAMLEAMMNGKVVFGSNVPGIRDQLAHALAHLFESDNAEDLAKTLQPFMRNSSEENEKIGAKFRAHALANYTIEREVQQHEKLYKALKKRA